VNRKGERPRGSRVRAGPTAGVKDCRDGKMGTAHHNFLYNWSPSNGCGGFEELRFFQEGNPGLQGGGRVTSEEEGASLGIYALGAFSNRSWVGRIRAQRHVRRDWVYARHSPANWKRRGDSVEDVLLGCRVRQIGGVGRRASGW